MQPLLKNTRRHDITFHRNGFIRITSRVTHLLNLTPGDSINIAVSCHDKACRYAACGSCVAPHSFRQSCRKVEYLLFAVHHQVGCHEASCYPSKKGSGSFCANSIRLCRLFFDSLGINADKVSFMVGEKEERADTIFLPIITSAPLLSTPVPDLKSGI